jgi:hypothetical protein
LKNSSLRLYTGTIKKNIQISTVLEVSIVDLCAADAFLVTVTPKALKQAMEQHIPKLRAISTGLLPNSLKARRESSSLP